MKKLLLLASFALPLLGCTTADPMYLDEGVTGYHIDCSWNGMGSCYKKANTVCPRGWVPINSWHNKHGGYGVFQGEAYPYMGSNIAVTVVCK